MHVFLQPRLNLLTLSRSRVRESPLSVRDNILPHVLWRGALLVNMHLIPEARDEPSRTKIQGMYLKKYIWVTPLPSSSVLEARPSGRLETRAKVVNGMNPQINQINIELNDALKRTIKHIYLSLSDIRYKRLRSTRPISYPVSLLHYASISGWEGTIDLLLEHGIDPRQTCMTGETALHFAVSLRHGEAAEILLKRSSDLVNEADKVSPG